MKHDCNEKCDHSFANKGELVMIIIIFVWIFFIGLSLNFNYTNELGQLICEEKKLGDYVSFDGEVVKCEKKSVEQKYDGIIVREVS